MVQLRILSGKKTGELFNGSGFPLRVGRNPNCDVPLDEPGVWPRHFQITREQEDLVCQAEPDALVSINGAPIERAVLRGGDVISVGAIKIQFALSPVRQATFVVREWLTWIGLALLCLVQVDLVYWLIR